MAFTPRFLKHRGITVIQKLDPALPRVPRGKVGLVLAGGAVAGGAFKAGGLRALDESLVRRRVPGGSAHAFGLNEFDVFVGLSAGSVLAAVLAAGIVPDEIFRILSGTSDMYETFQPWHFMSPNLGEWMSRVPRWLSKEQELLTNWLSGATDTRAGERQRFGATLRKMVEATARLIPSGLFDTSALEQYLRRQMARAGVRDDFASLYAQTGKALYLTATDLNRGEIVVFGHDEPYGKVRISTAIAASCAIPIWYRPMLVDNPLAGMKGEPDRLDLVDGGLMRTANVRVAVEKGCDLVVCYNPFTRIRYDRAGRSLHDHGMPTIATQSMRTLIGARLDLAKEVVFLDPDVQADVVFIEPAEDDYTFFNMGALNFWAKDRAIHHGYSAVRQAIDASHDLLAELFANHGIELRTPPAPSASSTAANVDMRESRGVRSANR
ncbi:MAG: Patatin [Myxococcales bacterium]|nr:Patatin [Myxococcales bacterium]